MTPWENRKSVTVFWLELTSEMNHLSSKPSNLSILSTESTQQSHGIAVIILKNSLPKGKYVVITERSPF